MYIYYIYTLFNLDNANSMQNNMIIVCKKNKDYNTHSNTIYNNVYTAYKFQLFRKT